MVMDPSPTWLAAAESWGCKKKDTEQVALSFELGVPGLEGRKLLEVHLGHECGCEGALCYLAAFLNAAFVSDELLLVKTRSAPLCPICIYVHTYLLLHSRRVLLSTSEQNQIRCKLKQSLHPPLTYSHLEPKMW